VATFALATLAFLCVWHTEFANMMPAYVGLFALGMCATEIAFGSQPWAVKARTGLPWKWIALGIFVVEAAVQYHWRTYMYVHRVYILDIINGLFSAALILAVASAPNGRLSRFLCWKPLAFVGTFAYSIYLMHAPLVQIVWQYGAQRLHLPPLPAFLTMAVGGGAAIIGFSYLFFLAFERPFLNTKPRADRQVIPAPAEKAG
jgi:peptidoglycan/LPS O-acetylase OafA/YrhL